MPIRLLLPASLVGVLVLAVLVLGQPDKPREDRLPSDLALVPGQAVGFLSVRLSEVLADPNVKALAGLVRKGGRPLADELREEYRVSPAEVERLTVVLMKFARAPVVIVRARGAIDRKAVMKDWQRNYGKWDKEKPKEVAEAREVRIDGRPYLIPGGVPVPLPREAEIIYPVDRQTMVVGTIEALTAFHAATGKGGPLAGARGLAAGTHHVVVAGRPHELLRQMAQRQRERDLRDRQWDKPGPPKEFDKGGKFDRFDKFEGKDKGRFDDKDKALEVKAVLADGPDEEFPFRGDSFALLPYKSLLRVPLATATLDVGKELVARARAECADEESAQDGQVAARSALYVAREMLGRLPREFGPDEGPAVLRKLVADLQRSLRAAKVTREGKVVTAEARHALDADTLKDVGKLAKAFEDRGRRSQGLKQIGLAMHNFHDAHGRFPAPALYTRDGKPGLSWRVALLPFLGPSFLEESKLYREFRLDEPWDSPTNRALLARMPKVYASPSGVRALAGHTYLRVFTGPDTPFPEPRLKRAGGPGIGDVSLVRITDGTSNTLMVVEASAAVPWTRPDELPFDPRGPLPKLGGAPGRFAVLFCDGAVRDLRTTLPPATLRALITANGGEVVADLD